MFGMVRKLKYVVGLGWYRLEDEPFEWPRGGGLGADDRQRSRK
jgi:hypothetical protein